jgi:Helicase HerA, central domain
MFVEKITGTLMRIEPNPDTRFEFEVWFDYTKSVINTIREGAFLAVPNFATNNQDTHYSILEVSSLLPVHYALGSDTSGFPGFVEEAARSAALDWEQQDESTEDTTKIRCVAIPTNLEMLLRTTGDPIVQNEENLPMVGSRVQLFNTEYTQRLANRGIAETENILTAGHLIRDQNVNIWLRIEDLLKVHFGIFGFTGAGKSNFVSTLTRRVLTESQATLKMVIVDLMSEYTALLVDQLVGNPQSMIVNLGLQTVPQSLVEYYAQPNAERLSVATRDMLRSTLFPKGLRAHVAAFEPAMPID